MVITTIQKDALLVYNEGKLCGLPDVVNFLAEGGALRKAKLDPNGLQWALAVLIGPCCWEPTGRIRKVEPPVAVQITEP